MSFVRADNDSPFVFVVYGCPFTAFHLTKDLDAFVVPEPDRRLYHLKKNINRILNLLGYSRIRNVWLIGCSAEFVEEFTALLRGSGPNRFKLRVEPRKAASFGANIIGAPRGTRVIVVEDKAELLLIAHHLSRHSGAKVLAIDPLSEDEQSRFNTALVEFEDASGLPRENALSECKKLIEHKLGACFLGGSFDSAAFVTSVPFNLYPFPYPTGHVPSQTAGGLIIAGMVKATIEQLHTGVAIVLDSARTQAGSDSEFGPVSQTLSRHCGILPGHVMADLGDFNHFIEDIPSDLIFITAHCGHQPMKTLRAVFLYKGQRQEVLYAVNRGVSAVQHSGQVQLETQYLPISVNGTKWEDKSCDRHLFMRFSRTEIAASWGKKSEDIDFADIRIESVDSPGKLLPAKGFESGDQQHFVPLTTTIGYYFYPLVFNNSCASYSGVCEEFISDSSFYVGTSRPVDSFSAVEVAQKFAVNLTGMTVGKALFEAQRPFINESTPYLLAGVPWLSMPFHTSSGNAIMKANQSLKGLIRNEEKPSARDRDTQQARVVHSRLVFQLQQRKALLKQLFNKEA